MASPLPNYPTPEQVSPGVTFEQLGHIFIFTLKDLSRQSIDAWGDKVQEIVDALPKDQHFMVLHHFDSPYVTLTPYLKSRTERMRAGNRSTYYAAIVLPGSGLIKMLASLLPRMNRNGTTRFFTSREEGLAWLQQLEY